MQLALPADRALDSQAEHHQFLERQILGEHLARAVKEGLTQGLFDVA